LFSSLYATLAAWTRVFPDMFGQMGWLNFNDPGRRKKMVSVLAIVFPIVWACMYLFINLPVLMVLSGGIVGSVMLLLVVAAGYHFKYSRQQALQAGMFYNIIFWISVVSILSVAVYGLIQVLT
jgi:manganese transport protein